MHPEEEPLPPPIDGLAVIVIPCFNEAARLDAGAFAAFVAEHPEIHLLFVDDGSSDDTALLLADIARGAPARVSVIEQHPNQGKAAAVRRGVLSALERGPRYVGYWDADLATPLGEIPRFLAFLEEQPACEAVFGSRVKLLGRSIERKLARHYLGRVFATLTSVLLPLPIYDTQCGAKLFRVNETLRESFHEPFVTEWIFDVEIIARMVRHHAATDGASVAERIYEMPLHAWRDVGGSKTRAVDFPRALWDLWKIHATYLRRAGSRARALHADE